MKTDVHGVVERRDGSVALRCCDCQKFMSDADATTRVVTGVMMIDPEWEYIHAPGTGCKR